MKRVYILMALVVLALTSAPAFSQYTNIKMTDQVLKYEWAFLDGKVTAHQGDGSLNFDFGTRSDYYFNWRVGIFRFGLYYKHFGIFARTAQVQGFWHYDDFPSEYLIFQPGIIGLTYVPFYSSSFSDEDKIKAIGTFTRIKGEANFALKFFTEGAFINEILRFPSESGRQFPVINRRFPTLVTAGMVVAYKYFSLELGYTYQPSDWDEFYQLGLNDSRTGINLSGAYFGINVNIGALHMTGRPYKITNTRPGFRASIRYRDDSGLNRISGGEQSVKVYVDVVNVGDNSGQGVKVRLTSSNDDISVSPPSKIIRKLTPGSKVTKEFLIDAAKELTEGNITLTARITDGKWTHIGDETIHTIFGEEAKRPHLSVVKTLIDDDLVNGTEGNANGQLDGGEHVKAMTIIENTGDGEANNVRVRLKSEDATFTNIEIERNPGHSLKPHQRDTLVYSFIVSKSFDRADRYPGFALTLLAENIDKQPRMSIPVTIPPCDKLSTHPVKSKSDRPHALGIIIYVNDYSRANMDNATFSRHDAEVMEKYFIDALGIPQENIEILRDPTKSTFEYYFGTEDDPYGWLYDRTDTGPDAYDYVDEVFIYYSGHGIVAPNDTVCYFIPADGVIDELDRTAYSRDLIFHNLTRLRVQRFFTFLETCFSGGNDKYNFYEGTSAPGGKRKKTTLEEIVNEPPVPEVSESITEEARVIDDTNSSDHKAPACYDDDITVFAATAGDETAKWYYTKHHGVFTYTLIKGLSGDADLDDNNQITVRELKRFLQSSERGVPHYAWILDKRQQHPTVHTNDDTYVLVEL